MQRIDWEDLDLGVVRGTGTVGTVYEAGWVLPGEQEPTRVAVKILQPAISQDKLVRARFRREMEILSRLRHPHIIRYYGGGEKDGQLFFAMELLEGGNLRDILERYELLNWKEVASIGRQVCSALQYAHNQGIVHRDLKPGNLFLDHQAVVKIGDFGIARDTNAADLTSQGLTVGTHAYMAPEQITGDQSINGKADLYSLGCVLFELLTGRKAFDGENFAVLFEKHLRQPPPAVEDFVPHIPAEFGDVINQLLLKDPNERPFNARTVQGKLTEILSTQAEGQGATTAITSAGTHDDSFLDGGGSPHDVGADQVIDVGREMLARKLNAAPTPVRSWRMLAIVAAIIVAVIFLAAQYGS